MTRPGPDDDLAVLECAECGSSAFNFTLDGRVMCDECGGVLGPYKMPGAIPDDQVH